MSLMIDHRQQRRRPVNFLLNKYVDGTPHLCRAVNLSSAGMLLHKIGEPELAAGTVELEFVMPDTDTVVRLRGQVLSELPSARAHAVRFTYLSREVQELIDALFEAEPLPALRSSSI